jgi:integrase
MKYTGCRSFTIEETERLFKACSGKYPERDRLMMGVGIYVGFRISEILSLEVRDLWDSEERCAKTSVTAFPERKVEIPREMPIPVVLQALIYQWMEKRGVVPPHSPMFPRQGTMNAITRSQAASIIKETANRAKLNPDRVSTHSLRKTFANRMWQSPSVKGDFAKMSLLLGHTNPANTLRYLEFGNDLNNAVLTAP